MLKLSKTAKLVADAIALARQNPENVPGCDTVAFNLESTHGGASFLLACGMPEEIVEEWIANN